MKCRLLYLHPDTNPGKAERLESLYREYVSYVRVCVDHMLEKRRYRLAKSEKRTFFPSSEGLSSQIVKNAQDHAIQIVSTWAKGVYARKMRSVISNIKREGDLTEAEAKALYTIGLKLIDKPWKFIAQSHINAYQALLDDYGGNKPSVSSSIPMRLSEMTSWLEAPDKALHAAFWLRLSSLKKRETLMLPLSGNPYITSPDDVSKGIQARKTRSGRWRFEVVEKKEWKVPEPAPGAVRVSVDVGLNVLATTSNGVLYGVEVKAKFDKLYARIRKLRANRQRQGFKENSPRLDCLESRLTGLMKTETGRIVNQLIKRHPDAIFVLEDLDLRGCRGQKRFAYRALQTNLASKGPVEVINPAYTSQECPSCYFISRRNRSGVRFSCKSCGKKAHADWVGANGILRRSGDKDITCKDRPFKVKQLLRERYILRRRGNSSLGVGQADGLSYAPVPLGQRFTTGVSLGEIGTASKSSNLPDLGRS